MLKEQVEGPIVAQRDLNVLVLNWFPLDLVPFNKAGEVTAFLLPVSCTKSPKKHAVLLSTPAVREKLRRQWAEGSAPEKVGRSQRGVKEGRSLFDGPEGRPELDSTFRLGRSE